MRSRIVLDFEKPYRQVSHWRAIWRFLFRPASFQQMADEHDRALMLTEEPHIRQQYLNGTLEEGQNHRDRRRISRQLRTFRATFQRTLLWAAVFLIVALVVAVIIGHQVPSIIIGRAALLQITGITLLLWAPFCRVEGAHRSPGERTLVERVARWLSRTGYVAGSVLLVGATIASCST